MRQKPLILPCHATALRLSKQRASSYSASSRNGCRNWVGLRPRASEQVMNRAHDLLVAASASRFGQGLLQQSIEEFLGKEWLRRHPDVQPFVNALAEQLQS